MLQAPCGRLLSSGWSSQYGRPGPATVPWLRYNCLFSDSLYSYNPFWPPLLRAWGLWDEYRDVMKSFLQIKGPKLDILKGGKLTVNVTLCPCILPSSLCVCVCSSLWDTQAHSLTLNSSLEVWWSLNPLPQHHTCFLQNLLVLGDGAGEGKRKQQKQQKQILSTQLVLHFLLKWLSPFL